MGLDRPNNFRNKYFFLFLMILILGIAVRFYNPTFRSLWGDEAHSFYLSQQIAPQTIVSVTSELIQESHLPVYFVLLSAWTKIFGISEYVLRLLSILIGVCGLMVFFGFARRLFDNKTALISLLLLALSPLAVMHSQEIRMYGLLFLFSTLSSSYFWLLLSKKRTVWSGIGYVFCSLLLLLTHIYGALIIIAQFLYLLFELWREEDKLLLVRPFLLQMFTCLLVIPFYARMLWLNLFAVVVGATDMAFSVFPWYLKFLLLFFVLSLGETVAPWDWLVVLPAGVILGCLLLRNLREFSDNRIRYLLFLCFVPILLAAMFLKPTMPKYLIICLPFYLLLVGHAIVQIKGQVLKYGLVLIIVIADLFSLNNYYNLHDYHNSNQIEPWRNVAFSMQNEYHKGDVVITTTHFVVYRLVDYYLNVVNKENVPIFDLEVKKTNIKTLKAPRIWLVTNIHDDRAFAPGYLNELKRDIAKKYKLISVKNYLPYEATLVSKLPIKRHESGTFRISVHLYERR